MSLIRLLSVLITQLHGTPVAIPPPPAPPPPQVRLPDRSFEIPAGSHDSVPGGIAATRVQNDLDRFLIFQLWFHADAAYLTTDPANQADWNKLMGLTTLDIHGDSLRLGWRYDPVDDEIELGLYAYIHGVRVDQYITSVAVETVHDVTLSWTEDLLSAEVDGISVEVAGPMAHAPRVTWVLTTTYFGGDETAPHDIHVEVRDIWTDA